jgi:uncharacterized membrane protein YtjA (UPF0391 family)
VRITSPKANFEETLMLRLALLFLVLGLVAALLGFGGVAGASFAIAKFLFWIFLVIFLVFLVLGLVAARKVSG